MRITYVNHACLFIEIGGRKVVTDPWFAGPAYADQWHTFPKPVNTKLVDRADTVLISHAHEDHLHEPSLRLLDKSKRVLYPFNWYAGTVDWIRSMGYGQVTETASCRTYDIGPDARVTYLVNSHDSIMVLEEGDEVLVNVNDALHSSEPHVIDTYTNYIKARWPRIEAVFCGFGGASYYPNTFHGPGKDDRAVAMLREQLFAHNFCRIVSRLAPRVAVPFAADFALLAEEQRWINHARFPREHLPDYFREQGGTARVEVMYTGDSLAAGRIEACSPLRERIAAGGLDELFAEQFPEAVSALSVERNVTSQQLNALRERLEANVAEQRAFYDAGRVERLKFSIHLRDVADRPWLNVSLSSGKSHVAIASQPFEDAVVELDTTSDVLSRSLESEWGGDAIIIGYACIARVRRQEDLRNGRGRICVELCVRHPRPQAYAKRHPIRVARSLSQNPFVLQSRLKHKARALFNPVQNVVSGAHWLSGDPAEIRRICGLPEFGPATADRDPTT